MRTVMIVDDEKLVRVGLRTIIDWEEYGYEVIGVYRNGQEAWEAICKGIPDILLTDIRMPRMDGLELIGKIKQADFPIHVVILSSHEDFEYTRKAIQLNVHDYLIKHELDTDEIVQVLNRLTYTEHTVKNNNISLLSLEKERFLTWMNVRKRGMENPIGWSHDEFPLLIEQLTKVPVTNYTWITFRAIPTKEMYHEPERKALSALLDETLGRLKAVYLGSHNECYEALLCLNKHSHHELTQQALKIAKEVIHTSRDNLNIELYCGLSSFNFSIAEVPFLHSEAVQAMQAFFSNGSGVNFFDETPRLTYFSENEWISLFNKVKELIFDQQFEHIYSWLKQQFDETLENVYPSEAIRFCEMVINNVDHYVIDRYQMDLRYEVDELRSAASLKDLYEKTLSIIQKCQSAIEEKRFKKGWIVETIEYIESNFDRPLRLEDVAGHVNFSVNYFSQRFHQEMGVLFTDYLMRYRINKAKEYFLQGKETTEEIAYKVGYTNTNYFIRVFKKVTGMTISKFKRNI